MSSRQKRSNAAGMKILKEFTGKRANGIVYSSDALDLLGSLKDHSAALVFLDPPFNLRKRYGQATTGDSRPVIEYERWLQDVVDESARILKPGGALFVYHLPMWAIQIASHLNAKLEFRHWIAISMKNGFARGRRLYPAHYALLYMTKGDPSFFSRPKLRPVRCRHCGELVKDYGGYLPIIRQKGLNLSDIWEDLSPVRHSNRKTRDANELPAKLLSRVVGIAGRRGQLFVDPFCGSGGSALAAIQRGMKFVVGDVVPSYGTLTASRISKSLTTKAKSTRGNK